MANVRSPVVAPEWSTRALGWAALAALVAIAVYVLGPVGQVLLIAFAGVLFGIFLDGLARLLSDHTPLGRGLALVVVLGVLVGVIALAIALIAPMIAAEVRTLSETLPGAVDALRDRANRHGWSRELLEHAPSRGELWSGAQKWISGAARVLRGFVGAVGALVVIGFVGLFVAVDPGVYVHGIVRIVPPRRRDRWREMLSMLREKLFFWVIGRLVNMAIIATLVSIGLSLLSVPAAVALGTIAGVLTFIPNIGPVISVIPAVLLGLTVSPLTVVWVLALFAAAQTLESYVVTPLIQRRAAAVPPAVLLVAQIVFGVPFGALGLLLATPLVAIAIVMTRTLYVEDRLERT